MIFVLRRLKYICILIIKQRRYTYCSLHLFNSFYNVLFCLQGMTYLHRSSLVSHGHLSTENCWINSRWVLKIGGFGLNSFVSEKTVEEVTAWNSLFSVKGVDGSNSEKSPIFNQSSMSLCDGYVLSITQSAVLYLFTWAGSSNREPQLLLDIRCTHLVNNMLYNVQDVRATKVPKSLYFMTL